MISTERKRLREKDYTLSNFKRINPAPERSSVRGKNLGRSCARSEDSEQRNSIRQKAHQRAFLTVEGE
jgi:hypothetical protein